MEILPPYDAVGIEIPLDTTVLYTKNGEEKHVQYFSFDPNNEKWSIHLPSGYNCPSNKLYLVKLSDSWGKLLENLDKAANAASKTYNRACCVWFNNDAIECTGCPADELPDGACNKQFIKDIAARIRKLSGED